MQKFNLRTFGGFTLIELAIVLLILGVLFGITIPLVSELTKHKHYISAQKEMDEIKQALVGYAGIHFKLPYADTTGDGVGDASQLTGSLPYSELGLGAVDPWRNRYVYDVNSRLVSPASQAAFCTALSGIASGEFPRVTFSAGGTQVSHALVVISKGENSALDPSENSDGDRDYESYPPTSTFDDLVSALSPNYFYGRLNCVSSGGGSGCSSYAVRNRRGGGIYVRGGTYAACTQVPNNQTFTLNSGESVTIYTTSARCNSGTAGTTISFANAQGADTNLNCAVRWNGSALVDE
jgi:prepilin-type N-terminal cleavage/methylation domain-containing protein